MSLIVCKDLSLGYDSSIVCENINFTVESGDYLCIVGDNGSGKTTLMRTLLGLMPALGGSIEFGEGLKRTDIGYLPQQTELQRDFPASVGEIVISGCLNKCGLRPFYNRSDRELAAKNMEKMGITHLKDRCYRELSGGQQQRVLLARALCAAGRLLLLDEPVAGLDPKVTSDMYDMIERLNKEGMTMIMISHDIAAAEHYATKILRLHDHRVESEGEAK